MKRSVLVGLVLLVLGAGTAAILLRDDKDSAPLPTRETLRKEGFAVWPQDTVDEATTACLDAEAWQLNPEQTALRFAREVLIYPEPFVDAIDPTSNSVRYLLNTRQVQGVFLGSVLDLKRYDRCWYIVRAESREDPFFDTVDFTLRGDQPYLVIEAGGLAETHVGYGTWDRLIENPSKRIVLKLPALETDATGHVMSMSRNRKGIVTGIAALPLGFVRQS